MADISGTYRHGVKPLCAFEATQAGEAWTVVVRSAGQRFERQTWAPSPWPALEALIADALDTLNRESEPARYDLNQKLPRRVSSTIRRGKYRPSGLGEWTAPKD